MRKIYLFCFILLVLNNLVYAQWPFQDIPPGHPAFDSIYNLTHIYGVKIEGKNFRGEDDITRFEFARIFVIAIGYVEKVSDRNLAAKLPEAEEFVDVPKDHWAYKPVKLVTNIYQVMSGDEKFKGEGPLTRADLAKAFERILIRSNTLNGTGLSSFLKEIGKNKEGTVSRYEAAMAIDLLVQKLISEYKVPLPSGIRETFIEQDLPLAFDFRGGGVNEDVTQTSNWLGYALGVKLGLPIKIFGRMGEAELHLGYDVNKIVYFGTNNYSVEWENRYLADILLSIPQTDSTSLLFGLEYIKFRNSFSPSHFVGFGIGAKSQINLTKILRPKIKLMYFMSIVQNQTVVSSYGAPNGRAVAEISQGIGLGGGALSLVYTFEDLLIGQNNNSRLYHTFGLRYNL